MQGQWLLVLGPCLLIHLSLISKSFERGHVSEGVPSDKGSPEGALHAEVCRYHPTMQILMYFLTCPPVVMSITLESLNKTDCLPTLVLMILILCLRLDMVGE